MANYEKAVEISFLHLVCSAAVFKEYSGCSSWLQSTRANYINFLISSSNEVAICSLRFTSSFSRLMRKNVGTLTTP